MKTTCGHLQLVLAAAVIFAAACSTTGVNPTGMTGNQVMCPSGPRPAIDCRGALQQYSRDFKADLSLMSKTTIGLAMTSTKLMEADALTSDLLQHSYQTCTLYNACIVSPEDYGAKTEKLQDLQMQVRRTLLGTYGQQQNIQINPPQGQQFPPPFPGVAGAQPTAIDLNAQAQNAQQTNTTQIPLGNQPGGPAVTVSTPPSGKPRTADTVLEILREGTKIFRNNAPTNAAPAPTPTASAPGFDLDSALRGMLSSLKQDVSKYSPALADARAVVGNFTEEGRPYGGPMGALLQDRVSTIVTNDNVFNQPVGVQSRGINVKDMQSVKNINDTRSLPTLYNTDLAIAGTYQTRPDGVAVKLSAVQNSGEIAQSRAVLPAAVIPDVVAAAPQNANDTNQLLGSMNKVAPRADGQLNITTNRPGQGSNFRVGEEITYFVNSNTDGFLYLFHVDGEKHVNRIFPNPYQPNPNIRAGEALQLPQPGAPFKFEAAPPFGLETTFAIVTPSPLTDSDLQMIQASFANPNQVGPTLARTRGIGPSVATANNSVLWNSATVLIRP